MFFLKDLFGPVGCRWTHVVQALSAGVFQSLNCDAHVFIFSINDVVDGGLPAGTSVYTCCAFIDLISCFIPSIVCSLFSPSVFLTHGSSRIFSVVASCPSSLDRALISCPFLVFTVTAVILVLVAGGSVVVSGLVGAVCLVAVLRCLDVLPSATSSATSLFGVGSGKGALALCVGGAVAIGRSVMAGGWLVCVADCAAVVGNGCSCWRSVCVSVVACGLAIIFAVGIMTKLDAVGVVIGVLLMTSRSCLLYFSGLTCLRMVLDLTTLLVMPKMFSFVEVFLPSQIAGKNLASIFGICFAVGNMYRESCFTKFTNWCLAFLVPASVVAGVAICMYCIPVQQVGCVFHHPWHDGMFAVSRVL